MTMEDNIVMFVVRENSMVSRTMAVVRGYRNERMMLLRR